MANKVRYSWNNLDNNTVASDKLHELSFLAFFPLTILNYTSTNV